MLSDIISLIILTFTPFLELRASIPYGILATTLPWFVVFLICVLTNAVLGPTIFFLIDKTIHLFLKIQLFKKFFTKHVEKVQKKIHPYVEKYGELGVALFIAVPLPGSGSFSGALGSYVLGLSPKKFIIANLIGVTIAGTIVTAVTLLGLDVFSVFIKQI